MISVVIAAHDEEQVLGRCLSTLLRGAEPGEIDVVVVCNGCSDATAEIAGSFGPPVTAVSTPIASKTKALNIGDGHVAGFPRFYLDADAELTIGAVRTIAAALDRGDTQAASPGLRVDVSGSSPLVRAYYRFWSALPSVRDDIVGRGAYALSEAGRSRFTTFPDVIADDHFVRTIIPITARRTLPDCQSIVKAPETMRALVRRSVRVQSGNRQVDPRATVARRRGWVDVVRRSPARVVDLPVYLAVVGIAKARSRLLSARGLRPEWGRDDSRGPAVTGASKG